LLKYCLSIYWVLLAVSGLAFERIGAAEDAPASAAHAPIIETETPSISIPNENAIPDNDPPGTVRLAGALTDVAKRYKFLVPPLPFPPFWKWRKWFDEHELSVHCSLEWKDANGKWSYAEMRSSKWDKAGVEHRVGLGQFPCTGYIAYSVYIFPGRMPRTIDQLGRPVIIAFDQEVKCDYRQLEFEIRKYGAFGQSTGRRKTNVELDENHGLGGPAYKPGQNSNTMVNYVLRKCGVHLPRPDRRCIGWETDPEFPYSTDYRYPKYDNQP
jgi:hypothetical protein